jgi:hypothetical protein
LPELFTVDILYIRKLIVMAYRSVAFVIKYGVWSLTSTSLSQFTATVKKRDNGCDVYIYVTLFHHFDKLRFGCSNEIATEAVFSYMQCVSHT